MKRIITIIILAAVTSFGLFKLGFRNVEITKQISPRTWKDAGFEVVGYEGYQWDLVSGGNVWHIIKRKDRPRIIYHGFVAKWRDEYHIYNLKAIDAIGPN
jgi:hypothetical protein